MAISEAKKRADAKWAKKTYDQIKFNSRKEKRLSELIDLASTQVGKSRAQYIEAAIYKQLSADHISINDLPPLDY